MTWLLWECGWFLTPRPSGVSSFDSVPSSVVFIRQQVTRGTQPEFDLINELLALLQVRWYSTTSAPLASNFHLRQIFRSAYWTLDMGKNKLNRDYLAFPNLFPLSTYLNIYLRVRYWIVLRHSYNFPSFSIYSFWDPPLHQSQRCRCNLSHWQNVTVACLCQR